MKTPLLILMFCMSLAATNAQDKIITIQKDTIECRIISVGAERISYEQKTAENYVIGKSIAISDVSRYFRAGQTEGNLWTDQPATKRQTPERRYLLTIQGGLARSFTKFGEAKNMMTGSGITASEADDYIGKLKNGYHIHAAFHYLLTNSLGVGADYTLFYSATEGDFLITGYSPMNLPVYINLSLDERLYTHFAGPSVLFQQFADKNARIKISETLAPGLVFFRGETRSNEYQIYWGDDGFYSGEPPQYYDHANTITSSTTFGIKAGLSLEYALTSQLSAGLAGSFMWAKLQEASFKSFNNEINDQELEKEINVSHLDYGFTVRYNF